MRRSIILFALIACSCGTPSYIGKKVTLDTIDVRELDSLYLLEDGEACISGSLFSTHRFSNNDNFIAPHGYEHVQVVDGVGELIFGDPLSASPHVIRMTDVIAINGWLAAVRPRVLLGRDEAPLTDRPRLVTVCGDLEQDGSIVLDGRTYEYRLMNWYFLSTETNPR